MTDERIVILFLKFPEKGKVKSRLAKDIGEGPALLLYQGMVLDTIDMLKSSKIPFWVFFDPPRELEALRTWLGESHIYFPQQGINLGERMELAFQRVFEEGVQEAVLIGTDIPGLTAGMVRDAFGAFAQSDAVIGPAKDGGYYLVGFRNRTFSPSIFQSMTWSTERVCQETLNRLRKAARTVHVLPACIDVDTREDLRALAVQGSISPSSRTMSLITRYRDELGL